MQEKYEKNTQEKTQHKARATNAIDFLIAKNSSININQLKDALQKENIQLVIWQNDHGVIYGLTYVDHQTKCVFNGGILGKQYSANAIQQRCKKIFENIQINLSNLKAKKNEIRYYP